jgi:VWFA-related protein
MSSRLDSGTVLLERYEIAEAFGSSEGTAAYLVYDLFTEEPWLLWESSDLFALRQKPPGVREYFQLEDRHYLVLRLERQTLSFILTVTGRLDENIAGLWALQICRAIGYWHNREGDPLICLQQGDLGLSEFRLISSDQVMIPSYGDFGRAVKVALPADAYRFSAPEKDPAALAPHSDVYALGAMLYCMLIGQPPPPPEALAAREAKLLPPRQLNPELSRGMEKILLKALQLDPRRRYPTAAEMANALEELIVQQSLEEEPERKPSLLMKALPFLLSLLLLACVGVAVEGIIKRPKIEIPWFKGPPTPTFTPRPTRIIFDTPTPTPTFTPAPTSTPLPLLVVDVVLNQVRTDSFPRVIAYTSVLDANQEPLLGIDRERFYLRSDGIDVTEFQVDNVDAARDPLAMVVAIDISGSMKGEALQKARAAASNFVGRFEAADEVSLVKFDDQIELVHDFTRDKEAIVEAISTLRARNDTALYDVIGYSIDQLSTRQGRRAAIILTDGRDTASVNLKLRDAIAKANEVGIPVYVVGLQGTQFTPQVMEQISTETGGEYLFAPSPDALDALYQKIRGQLQNQYRIEFTADHGADGAVHLLAIGVDLGGGQQLWSEKEYHVP